MQCGDETKEWVEIYNPSMQILNLSEWKIRDNYATDDIVCLESNCSLITNASFFIILGNSTNISLITNMSVIHFYVDDKQIGNGLADSSDSLTFFTTNYSTSMSYNSNSNCPSKSISRNPDGVENWTFCTPTPGAQNNCSQQSQQEPNIQLNYPQEVQCNENFSITLGAFNFEDGIYDVKIDILDAYDESHRVGQVWNGTKWLSTNSYVNSVLNISNGNGTATLTYKVGSFEGEAILRPRIRKTGSSSYEQFNDYPLEVQCQINQQEESEIKIVDAPSNARFGATIEVELQVYKGDTKKYAVYVYVQNSNEEKVSDKVTLHFNEKFTNYTEKVSLTLDCKNEQGTYEIVANGLDTQDTKEIELNECEESNAEGNNGNSEGITIGDFTYSFTIPSEIYLNQAFQVKVKITNNGDKDKSFRIWSYVYQGSKCYSCEDNNREANAKAIEVKQGSFSEAVLDNIVPKDSGAEVGTYKLKIKILQEDLKTPKEFTYNITLMAPESSTASQQIPQTQQTQNSISSLSSYSSNESNESYESEQFSLIEILPYVLTSVALLAAIYLIITKV